MDYVESLENEYWFSFMTSYDADDLGIGTYDMFDARFWLSEATLDGNDEAHLCAVHYAVNEDGIVDENNYEIKAEIYIDSDGWFLTNDGCCENFDSRMFPSCCKKYIKTHSDTDVNEIDVEWGYMNNEMGFREFCWYRRDELEKDPENYLYDIDTVLSEEWEEVKIIGNYRFNII